MVYFIIGLLCAVIVFLLLKIHFIRMAAKEIAEEFSAKLENDTNGIISISSRDKYMCRLASEINIRLRKLRKARIRYERGDAELKNAVTNISHDLRTPLTAVCGYLDLLEAEEKSPEAERYIGIISERIGNMKKLTEELFRYSVVMSGNGLNMENTDLCKALENSLISFYAEFTRRGISPEIDIPETPVVRCLDSSALNRIFSNIISNASKYTDGDFRAELKADGRVIFSNTASGLNNVMTEKLFDRFFTVETSRNSTGLGLSIAKHLTESMNGSINAEYKDGKLFVILEFPENNL